MTKTVFRTIEPFILASASPRRRELLRSVGLTFEVVPSGSEENGGRGEAPGELVKRWAVEKAGAVSRVHRRLWVLAADTIVVLDGVVFGKPKDASEAVAMLERLSGRIHEVTTAVCLMNQQRSRMDVKSVVTQVRFKELTPREIEAYVKTGEPFDKAGGYGIQGMGAFLVESVHGSYTNVVGLPLCETLNWLLERGVIACNA